MIETILTRQLLEKLHIDHVSEDLLHDVVSELVVSSRHRCVRGEHTALAYELIVPLKPLVPDLLDVALALAQKLDRQKAGVPLVQVILLHIYVERIQHPHTASRA